VKVRVFLRTPLHRGRVKGARKYELGSTVVEVVGEAAARDGGLEVDVTEMVDNKGESIASPWSKIFLPLSKIDLYVIE
jgi:hypothetical protein